MSQSFTVDPPRTRVLSERWGSWILPHWLERQADPTNAAFVPVGVAGGVVNTTMVDRTPVGLLDGGAVATIDPRGLVTPRGGAWSLDWWIGGDDRWHVPSREVAVRQSVVSDAPVVETAMRVPGGDIVQRVWAFHDAAAGEVVAIEIENASRLPVAVALGIRPYGPDGAGRVDQISIARDHLSIDGELAVWLPKPAAHLATSNLADGDSAASAMSGGAPAAVTGSATCAAGFANAALIYPLAHTATVRFLVPVRTLAVGSPAPSAVPPHDAVARGWATHLGQGARVEIPDPELTSTLAAASAQLLMAASGRDLAGESSTTETATLVGVLDRLGLHDQARAVVATLPDSQSTGGRLGGVDPAADATSAALLTAGRHWRVARDNVLAADLAGPLAAGAHHHTRSRPFARRSTAAASPNELGWRVRAILDVADALDGGGQPEAAVALRDLAADARAQLDAALEVGSSNGVGGRAGHGRIDAGAVQLLELVAPLGVVDPRHPLIDAVLAWTRDHLVHDHGIAQLVGATGLSPTLTSLVGRAELRRGERAALDRLDWLVRTGGPVRTWPDLVHPRLGSGCGGGGSSSLAAAAVVDLLLDLLVHESADSTGLVLCSVVPPTWFGAGWEVHGLPTELGPISYAVRWHGERPALLWEFEPHDPSATITLTIPGLDPSWSTTDPRGDALLAVPPAPADAESGAADDSPSSRPFAEPAPAETPIAGIRIAPKPPAQPGKADSGLTDSGPSRSGLTDSGLTEGDSFA